MLSTMRRRVKIILFIVAAGFIAGFLMSEVWQLIKSRERGRKHQLEAGVVGIIDKERVGINEYRQVLDYIGQKYRQESLFRDLTNEDEIRIEDLAWNYLVQERTWQKILKETKLEITDAEIEWILTRFPPSELQNQPALMTDGKFDTSKYYEALHNPQNRPFFIRYAREIYEQLRPQKLRMYVSSTFHLNPKEIEENLAFANTVVSITTLHFGPATVTEEMKGFEPTEAQLREYYQKHIEEFSPKEEIRELSYILFPLKATAADSENAKQRIEEAYHRLLAADTANWRDSFEMASLSLGDFEPDTSSVRFLSKQFSPTVESIVRRLKPGEWTKPIAGENSYQIVLLDSTKGDTFWVRRIRTRIKPDNAREMAVLDQIREFIEQAKVAGFESTAVRFGLKIPPFPVQVVSKKPNPFGITIYNPTQLTQWAREAHVGDVMETPLRGPEGFYVFKFNKLIPPRPAPLEEVKEIIRRRVIMERERELWEKKAEVAIAAIKAGKSLNDYANENPGVALLKKEIKGCFDNERTVRGVEFVAAVLALEPGQTVGPIKTRRGAYIIRCEGKRASDPPVLPVEHYLQQKQEEIFGDLWQELTQEPEIKDWRPLRGY